MDKEKIFKLSFKIGLPLLLFVLIAIAGVYLYSFITNNTGIIPPLFIVLGVIGLIASILLFVSWVTATIEIIQSEKVTTSWKLVWILVFILNLWPLGSIYYYFWGRNKLFSK